MSEPFDAQAIRERAEQVTARLLVRVGHSTTEEAVVLVEEALTTTRREGWQIGYSASEATYGLLRKRAEAAEARAQRLEEALRHIANNTHDKRSMQEADATLSRQKIIK